ncbi:hypothetical protein J3E69DRAFT_322901 [Trichoderma sp. SZMC 28015]
MYSHLLNQALSRQHHLDDDTSHIWFLVLVSARRWQNADRRMGQWLVSPEACELILSAMAWPRPACTPPRLCPVISATESLRRITVHYLHARRRRQCHASARFSGGRLPLGIYQWLESDAPAQGLGEMGWLVDQSTSSGLCCSARVVSSMSQY